MLLCGPIADHGMAVMLARGDLAIAAPIESDTQAINHYTSALFNAVSPHWLRDATRMVDMLVGDPLPRIC